MLLVYFGLYNILRFKPFVATWFSFLAMPLAYFGLYNILRSKPFTPDEEEPMYPVIMKARSYPHLLHDDPCLTLNIHFSQHYNIQQPNAAGSMAISVVAPRVYFL